jgi:catalase
VLLSDGFDGALLAALEKAVHGEGGVMRFVAPRIGGVACSNDILHAVTDQIGGAPSALFDAVTLLPGGENLAGNPAAVDFVNDALLHCKFVGWAPEASELLKACGLQGFEDDALRPLDDTDAVTRFATSCRGLRHWPREAALSA